jgi:signal transduction histidine kinase
MLRTAWELPAAPGAPARVWRDWALVGALLVLAVVETLVRPDLPWRWPTLVVELAVIPTLLWRRTHPGLVTALAFGTLFVWDAIRAFAGVRATDSYVLAALLILVYALVRWGSGREIVAGGAVVLAAMVRSFTADAGNLQNTLGGIAIVTVCVALGAAMRTRESARRQRLERVRLEERERLARDLHDTVAHHVSAIAVRAQAGILTAQTDPDAADAALRVIEDEAAQTLREMRSMVQVLRDGDPAPRTPAATLADLAALADAAVTPAVTVEVRGDVELVPETVAGTAFRIAQESITNARRHARDATRIDVIVTIAPDRVGLSIRDDGTGGGPRGQGYGIAGMTERAALLGGSCTAGPAPGGGWSVDADLPFAPAAKAAG